MLRLSMPALILLSGIIVVAIAVYAWRRQSTLGARPFAVFMFLVALYILAYGMEITSPDLKTALFWNKIQYIGILTFPTMYLIFVIQYIGQNHCLTPRKISSMFALPSFLFIVKLFDDHLGLIYDSAALEFTDSISLLIIARGPLYTVATIYHLSVVTFGNYLLFQKRRFSSYLFRVQSGAVLSAALIVYLVSAAYLAEIPLFPSLKGFDFNPFAYAIWGGMIGFAIFRYRLLDLAPIAREALIEMLSDGVIVLDTQFRIVDANPAALKMFRWGKTPLGAYAGPVTQGWIDKACLETLTSSTKKELHLVGKDGTVYYEVMFSVLKEKRGHKIGYLMVAHDISERKEVENELHELSLMDELTGLTNRRGFKILADQLIIMASRMQINAVLFYLDLDRLKWINDNLGHNTGDQAIKDAANILRRSFRSTDILARIGGDEFVVLAIESQENSHSIMLDRFQEELQKFTLSGARYCISFSIGVSHYQWNRPRSIEVLLDEADQDMYRAKQGKKIDRIEPK